MNQTLRTCYINKTQNEREGDSGWCLLATRASLFKTMPRRNKTISKALFTFEITHRSQKSGTTLLSYWISIILFTESIFENNLLYQNWEKTFRYSDKKKWFCLKVNKDDSWLIYLINKNKNSINTTEAFSLTLNQSSRLVSYRSNSKCDNCFNIHVRRFNIRKKFILQLKQLNVHLQLNLQVVFFYL